MVGTTTKNLSRPELEGDTVTTTPQPKERIKVWRPQGFAGVEVELFENISEFNVPLYFMDGFYEITVARGPETKLHYMNTDHRFNAHEDLFLIQHPGETVGATALDEETADGAYLAVTCGSH